MNADDWNAGMACGRVCCGCGCGCVCVCVIGVVTVSTVGPCRCVFIGIVVVSKVKRD